MFDVSVVIPCFNAEAYVARAILSILNQPDIRAQIIVIDDGSTDNSLNVIKEFGDQIEFRTGPNAGVSAARNKGLALAKSAYTQFLDADDYIMPGGVRSLLSVIQDSPCDIVFGKMTVRHKNGRLEIFEPPDAVGPEPAIDYLFGKNIIGSCSIVWSTDFLKEIGGWMEGLPRREDVEMISRAIARGANPALSPCGDGLYFQHDGPDRIDSRTDPEAITAILDLFGRVDRYFTTSDSAVITDAWLKVRTGHAYGLYKAVLTAGDPAAAERARLLWVGTGGRRHEGTRLHRIACSLLGLPLKQRLASHMSGVMETTRLARQKLTFGKSTTRPPAHRPPGR